MGKLAWIPIVSSILGILLVFLAFVGESEEGAAAAAAAIALGIALSVIPYVLIRAFVELRTPTD